MIDTEKLEQTVSNLTDKIFYLENCGGFPAYTKLYARFRAGEVTEGEAAQEVSTILETVETPEYLTPREWLFRFDGWLESMADWCAGFSDAALYVKGINELHDYVVEDRLILRFVLDHLS